MCPRVFFLVFFSVLCVFFQVVDVIKKDILSAPTRAPKSFLEKLTSILNKGSIHTASDQFNGKTSLCYQCIIL